jgi:predicted PurR-regulated permease PerM
MRVPINAMQLLLQQVEDIGGTGPSPNGAVSERGAALLTMLFTGTRNFASGFLTTVLFLFFLLVSGDIFLHRLVEILPHFSSKRQVVEISRQIEQDISAYLITITIMNAAVGIAMALAVGPRGGGRPNPLGDGGVSAKLCADPRHCFGRVDLSSRWPVDP